MFCGITRLEAEDRTGGVELTPSQRQFTHELLDADSEERKLLILGGDDHLAVFILQDARRLQAAGAVRHRVVVGLLGRADLQGQVRDPVAVRSDPLAEPGPGPGRAAEDEPIGGLGVVPQET